LIRAILFDLGRVIVPFEFRRGYERMEPHCGIPATEIPKRIGETDLVRRFEKGQISPQDFVRDLTAHLGLQIGYEEFCGIWTSIFLPHTLVPESLIKGLAARYRMILVSNTNEIHFEMIRRTYPLLRHFHVLVLSHEAGSMKPEPEIYRRAIEAAGCEPGECFFTDDMPEFIAGARTAGIDAVQFENAEQLRRELRSRGVEWTESPPAQPKPETA
jgi:putative hydrolase of the HAD superfamily